MYQRLINRLNIVCTGQGSGGRKVIKGQPGRVKNRVLIPKVQRVITKVRTFVYRRRTVPLRQRNFVPARRTRCIRARTGVTTVRAAMIAH